ncbi:LysR family transcriptional regulator [Paraburkholderia antibiotica]|uniref:LysR family transcriptional regulator n=1 Tax=Paraburkholderia antibiotica TaxID=2728839 RepID=A0A7Y0A2D8_9BURK|nr:LysR family transcriptional regulator [Paraburkholderia antibiotica]NML35241.1 LysR family transcriptional regulator [Paraburkholderia antibiotica]
MEDSGIGEFGTLEMFCAAARARSFTAASIALGTTPSAISKAVQRLETRLGLKLFQRTTRAIRLTDDGLAYFKVCQQALDNIRETEQVLSGHRMPRGVLRVSLPDSYGIKRVAPLIPAYTERYLGHVRVEASLNNALADFVEQGFDLAIRLGKVADSRLGSRPLHDTSPLIVASPDYLRRHPALRTPEDLHDHTCVGLWMPDSGKVMPWTFGVDGQDRELSIRAAMTFDHPFAVSAAVLSGGGLAQLLDFTVEEELRSGRLVEVLAPFRPSSRPVSAVYLRNRYGSAKVRTFVDFLLEANAG